MRGGKQYCVQLNKNIINTINKRNIWKKKSTPIWEEEITKVTNM